VPTSQPEMLHRAEPWPASDVVLRKTIWQAFRSRTSPRLTKLQSCGRGRDQRTSSIWSKPGLQSNRCRTCRRARQERVGARVGARLRTVPSRSR